MKSAFTLMIALLVSFAFSGRVAAINPPTALIVLKDAGTLHEYSPVLEYSSVDFESAAALKVLLPNGKSITITRDQIGHLFQYPHPTATLTSVDSQALSAKRAEASALATKYPNARAALQRVVTGLDADLHQLAAGKVRYSGVWQMPGSPTSTPGSGKPALTVNGTAYQGADITRLDNGVVVLKHEGGIARVPLAGAPPELLALLRSKTSIIASFRPLRELVIDQGKLANAALVGQQDDTLIILHDGGVLAARRSELSERQSADLLATNPPLMEAAKAQMEVTKAQALKAEQAGKLVLNAGDGTRNPELGWPSGPDEKMAWEAAAKEQFTEPSTFAYLKKQLSEGSSGQMIRYKEAAGFINGKIAPYEVGYSAVNKCMLLRLKEEGGTIVVAAFHPRDLNANVRYRTLGEDGAVILEVREGSESITYYTLQEETNGSFTLWRDRTSELTIPTLDSHSAERVANALMQLIMMLGGRGGNF